MAEMPDAEQAFRRFHSAALRLWRRAMASGDTSALEAHMADDYRVFFFRSGRDAPDCYDRAQAAAGMRRSVEALRGARKRFRNRVVRMRGDDEAVVFFEQIITRDGRDLARMFTVETWRRSGDRWVCVREIVEHLG